MKFKLLSVHPKRGQKTNRKQQPGGTGRNWTQNRSQLIVEGTESSQDLELDVVLRQEDPVLLQRIDTADII